jgi:AraC-like DNA-binding protein
MGRAEPQQRSAAERWEAVAGQPHPSLAGLVRDYQGYRETTAAPMRRREMPAAQVVMIIDFGPTLRILDEGGELLHRHRPGFLAGLHDGFTLTETDSAMSGVQVNFTLTGARAFLSRPAHELTGRVVALDDVLGAEGRQLRERLASSAGWPARFRMLDELILARVARAAPLPAWLQWAWSELQGSDGLLSIGALAREVGFSRKHLAASFRETLGTTPKALARLLRFQRALAALRSGRHVEWAEVALDCGYCDQAHFSRDFRQYSGGTPTDFLRRRLPGGRGVRG